MSEQHETIDDLIILGNAMPDEISGGRKSVCTAGYSPSRDELIRLYPVPINVHPARWAIYQVPVTKDKRDVRSESWKIQGSHDEWNFLYKKLRWRGELPKSEQKILLHKLIDKFKAPCVKTLNENRESLGIITPKNMEGYFADRKTHDPTFQVTLDSEYKQSTIHNFEKQPRLKYTCSECQTKKGYHDQQIIEWGTYVWMGKHPDQIEKVWDNLRIYDSEYEHHLLVGNQARHLTSFMVISLFRFKKS